MFERQATNDIVEVQTFHFFTDASQDVYAAVMFERNKHYHGSISDSLVTSKSTVSPLKSLSIPHLELHLELR